MRIALLEDDVDVGATLKQWLDAAGHSVHHFTSGKAIVREAGRESFDLYMLDWHVPDMSFHFSIISAVILARRLAQFQRKTTTPPSQPSPVAG